MRALHGKGTETHHTTPYYKQPGSHHNKDTQKTKRCILLFSSTRYRQEGKKDGGRHLTFNSFTQVATLSLSTTLGTEKKILGESGISNEAWRTRLKYIIGDSWEKCSRGWGAGSDWVSGQGGSDLVPSSQASWAMPGIPAQARGTVRRMSTKYKTKVSIQQALRPAHTTQWDTVSKTRERKTEKRKPKKKNED